MGFDKEIADVYLRLKSVAERYYYPTDSDLAHDLAASAVERAILNRDKYDESKPLVPWCMVIMRNIFLSSVRNRRHTVSLDMCPAESSYSADQMQRVNDILLAVRSMGKSKSVSTLMMFAKGYSIAEISLSLGVPVGTVKRRIHDARAMLSKMLEL